MIPFNYHHLYYFYTVAKLGSVTRAAQELRIGQPALSAQVRQFESYLNTRLLMREGRGVRLTEEGRTVQSYAKEIFELGREFIDHFGDLSAHRGRHRIQIGVGSTVPKTFVDRALAFLLDADPRVYLAVEEDRADRLAVRLERHELDVLLSDTPLLRSAGAETFHNHLVAAIPVVFCAHPRTARRLRGFPKGLHGFPVILPTSDSQVSRKVKEFFIEHRIEPEIVGEIEDVELVRRLALSGSGVAPLNQLTALHAPSRGRLVVVGRPASPIEERLYLITRPRRRPHPLVSRLIEGFRLAPEPARR